MKIIGFAILLVMCVGCTIVPTYPFNGPQTRDDGTLVPAPAYTNLPDVYHDSH